jgi:hypothetical protein
MLKKIQTKKDNQVFSRFEMKYILNKNLSLLIQNEIKNFMTYDGYINKNAPEKKYYVRSIYFDNDDYSNFNEKVDGLKIRHKFRIRTYSNKLTKNSKLYLEEKGRLNQRTYKVRTKIMKNDLEFFFDQKKLFQLRKNYKDKMLIEKFVFESIRKKVHANVIIDYDRSPFVNNTGLYFRLTFDSNIRSCISNSLFNINNQWKTCIDGFDILEVKFDTTVPAWFQKIIQSFELNRLSISKYVLGLEATGLAEDYEGK